MVQLSRNHLIVACRMVIGVVFVWSSFTKIVDLGEFYNAVLAYQIVGPQLSKFVASTLPWLELVLGVSILGGFLASGSLMIAQVLLVFFVGLQSWAAYQGLEIACGCFGTSAESQPVGVVAVIRTAAFAVIALFPLWFSVSWDPLRNTSQGTAPL